jgi:hypothetical protein
LLMGEKGKEEQEKRRGKEHVSEWWKEEVV